VLALRGEAFGFVDLASQDAIDQIQVGTNPLDLLALLIHRSRGAGAELFGKTTTDTFGHDAHLFSEPYGP
jgi:hypothetical protein